MVVGIRHQSQPGFLQLMTALVQRGRVIKRGPFGVRRDADTWLGFRPMLQVKPFNITHAPFLKGGGRIELQVMSMRK